MKLLLQRGQVLLDRQWKTQDVLVDDGVVVSICSHSRPDGQTVCIDVQNQYIVPGFVDVHVHLREPGFSSKETIATGTAAAARGGYTAVCSMPNLTPPPDTPEHLAVQQDIIAQTARVPVYPYGTITMGQAGAQLTDMEALAAAGAIAFSDDGKGVQDDAVMARAMGEAARLGKIIAAHCEDERELHGGYIHDGAYAKAHGHRGINSRSEWGQVARDLALVEQTGCRYHVCHISTKQSVQLIREAKAKGLPVTCETAPHYLVLCEDDLQEDGRFKMNPPLRTADDRAALIEGLCDGTIDIIATDHAPHTAEEKSRGLQGSPMGVVGLECAFAVLYTELVKPGILPLAVLIERMSDAPRRIFSLGDGLAVGARADLCVLDLDCDGVVDPDCFYSQGRATPFAGRAVAADIRMTMVEGRMVWNRDTM